MNYSLTHLADHVLGQELVRHAGCERGATAILLAYIAEFDARHLYLPAGYTSMFAYCVGELRLGEEGAYKRIHVARTARSYPTIFDAIADGRLNLATVRMIASHLNRENADELIAAASNLTREQVERMLAGRFPQPEALRLDEGTSALPATRMPSKIEQVPGPVQFETPIPEAASLPPVPCAPTVPTRITPIAAQSFSLQVTIEGQTHEKLRRAQDLLSHAIPSRDVAVILDRALSILIEDLEKRKFSQTAHRRDSQGNAASRNIPALVKRAIYQRDAGRCAFVAPNGHRCMRQHSWSSTTSSRSPAGEWRL